ncbi:MAG TPA: hypothetical protein VGE88_11565 [Lysobacter sp.]
MKCTVYWGSNGFVVVPNCVLASRDAERRHGPLLECGFIETDDLDSTLAEDIGLAIDQSTYACVGPDLALHLSYRPLHALPLPYGFRWQSYDEDQPSQPMLLMCGTHPPVLVAELMPMGEHGGWMVITGSHKAWAFRGLRVAQTHAVAMHFIAAWAGMHATAVRSEILRSPVAIAAARSPPVQPRIHFPQAGRGA